MSLRKSLILLLALCFTASAMFDSHKVLGQKKRKLTAISREQAKERLKKLRNHGITVFYPNFVPARFSLVTAMTIAESECPNLDYYLEFCDQQGLCFSIESACGGIGDGPDGDKTLTGQSKIFGRFYIEHFNPGSEGNGTKLVYFLSNWWQDKNMRLAKKKGIYRGRGVGRYHHFLGHGVTDKEAVAIVKSLTPLQ